VQRQAIEEVIAQPVDAPQRERILRLVASWKVRIDMGELAEFVQREEIMTITKAFEVWEQETTNKGRQEGRQERNIEIALNLLRENIPVEAIVRSTGLTVEQIQALQSQASQN
jgi:predicted transposase YdaD